MKNKHPDAEEDMEAEQQEVKRLKFSKEDEDEEDDEDDEEEEQEEDTMRPAHNSCLLKEAEAMVQEDEEVDDEAEKDGYSKENEASSSAATTEVQGKFCCSLIYTIAFSIF